MLSTRPGVRGSVSLSSSLLGLCLLWSASRVGVEEVKIEGFVAAGVLEDGGKKPDEVKEEDEVMRL